MGGFYAENYAALYSWQHAMHHVDGWGDEYLRDGEFLDQLCGRGGGGGCESFLDLVKTLPFLPEQRHLPHKVHWIVAITKHSTI